MKYKFKDIKVNLPKHDADITIKLPNEKLIVIQSRPSNAEPNRNYAGSLDIVFEENKNISCFVGDDLKPAPKCGRANERLTKQIITDLN